MSGGVAVVIYSSVSCRPEHNTLPPTPTPPPPSPSIKVMAESQLCMASLHPILSMSV